MYTHVHSSTVHRSQKVETAQLPLPGDQTDKMWYIHTRECYSVLKKKAVVIHVATQMNLENSMLIKKAKQEGHMLYDSICMKNVQRQSTDDQWLSKTGFGEKVGNTCSTGVTFPFRQCECFWNQVEMAVAQNHECTNASNSSLLND